MAKAAPPGLDALERMLDRTIAHLTSSPPGEARALLIEARRLRSVVANWRSIPPPAEMRDEMVDRVRELGAAVGAAIDLDRPRGPGSPSSLDDRGPRDGDEVYSLDFEPHLYSLEPQTNVQRPPIPQPPRVASFTPPLDDEIPLPHVPIGRRQSISDAPPPAPIASPRVVAPAAPTLPAVKAPTARELAPRAAEPERRATASAPPPPLGSEPAEERDLAAPRAPVTVEAVTLGAAIPPPLVLLAAPNSAPADALRALRRKLAASGDPRVIGVTSARAGEGKTTFAINLALTLRESARGRVLLIEADHRAPGLARMLGITPSACFLQQIAARAEDPRAPWIVAEPMAKLHVMALDPRVKHEPRLDPVAFGSGMDRLKQAGYDYIIVDAPAVIGSVDCNVISDSVDGMILTALTMRSRRREMRKAVEQIAPATILGVVVMET